MTRRIRRRLSCSSSHRRLGFEHLEDRRVLASFGDSAFAVFEGEVAVADQPATLEIAIDPAEFELVKGEVTLGFQVRAKSGEALSPQPARVVDAQGNPVEPEPGEPLCRAGGESLALVSLGAGTYEIQISGDESSIGAFQLAIFLAGDVDGNRRVDADDTRLLRDLLNTSTASPAYELDADVNRDGRITGYDLSLQRRNLGAAVMASAPLSFEVDPALVPDRPELSPVTEEDTGARPTARLTDSSGMPADFVANELILMTSDDAKLDAFVDRWQGELLLTIDPAEYGVAGLEKMHVVRVDASGADAAKLSQDLKSLDPNAQGAHRVSSPEGLKLLAAAAHEAAAGNLIAVNWIGKSDQFLDRTTVEAPIPAGGSFDAFQLPHLAEGDSSNQDTGVAEAWRVLELADRLGNRVDFAVLDGGFVPDADWPAGFTSFSTVPFTSPLNSPGPGNSIWHGTNVVSAGMALPDNAFGSAGPAGPIARPITVYTQYDFVTSIASVLTARFAGADIINMSYRTRAGRLFRGRDSLRPDDTSTSQRRRSALCLGGERLGEHRRQREGAGH
jgi:hypothetical protein